MFRGLRHRFTVLARRSAFGLIGALLLVVALGFLTAAVWYGLVPRLGPAWSAVVLGTVYLVMGLICLLFARGEPQPDYPPALPASPMERVMQSFLDGVNAGSQIRRARR